MLVADYGAEGGGWGPVAVQLPNLPQPTPFVYTNDATEVLAAAHKFAAAISEKEGREVRVVRFTEREDLGVYEPGKKPSWEA